MIERLEEGQFYYETKNCSGTFNYLDPQLIEKAINELTLMKLDQWRKEIQKQKNYLSNNKEKLMQTNEQYLNE